MVEKQYLTLWELGINRPVDPETIPTVEGRNHLPLVHFLADFIYNESRV